MRIPEAIIPRSFGITGELKAAESATQTAAKSAAKDAHAPLLGSGAGRASAGTASPSALATAGSFEGIAGTIAKPKIAGAESGLNLANPATVNHHNSLRLMQVCKDSYTDFNHNVGHTQFLHREYSDHQILAFSGSKELKDWAHDANIIKSPYRNMGWLHNGFTGAYEEIRTLQDSVLNKNKPIVVTGHSLGGATAHVAAMDLKARGYDVHSLTTFGCPNVGGSDWKANFDKAGIPSFRYVNAWDVVPRIPKIGYEPVGQPFFLSTKGEMLPKQQSGWELAWKPWELASQRVASHHMPNYQANLQKYLS